MKVIPVADWQVASARAENWWEPLLSADGGSGSDVASSESDGGWGPSARALPLNGLDFSTRLIAATSDSLSSAGQLQDVLSTSAGQEDEAGFLHSVMASTQEFWGRQLGEMGVAFKPPQLNIFQASTEAPRGMQNQQPMGYNPQDATVYLRSTGFDFVNQYLSTPLNSMGKATLLAHEVGHAVQDSLGYRLRSGVQPAVQSPYELQADCLTGMWFRHVDRQVARLAGREIDSAANYFSQLGGDNVQTRAGQSIDPTQFHHGSGAQREYWFLQGYLGEDGLTSCNVPGAIAFSDGHYSVPKS